MKSISRREILKCGSLALGAAVFTGIQDQASAQNEKKDQKMNILFILTDQQRADTIRCYGNEKVQTPALDALAADAMRFTSCYVTQPVCTPCRGSIITGKYPSAINVWENKRPLKDHSSSWMRILAEKDYATCYVGKWHLGDGHKGPDYLDVWHGYETGWPHWIEDKETGEKTYRPDEETDFAIDWMSNNKDKPFMCFVSYYPPHTPKTAPDEDLKMYEDVFEDKSQQIYHAMVHRIDQNVGRLMGFLKESGLEENTIVVFTSDHGENFPRTNWWNEHYKRSCNDQAASVPLIVRVPGQTRSGSVETLPVSSADLCPTILTLMDCNVPDDIHGQSFDRLLSGERTGWREDLLIQNRPHKTDERMERCLITDKWKLILNTERPPELYDRKAAKPDSVNMFASVNSEIKTDLFKRLNAWGKKINDPLVGKLVQQYYS
jgi:arylsulfatase A-like enzyme